jgi:hypothetical protein
MTPRGTLIAIGAVGLCLTSASPAGATFPGADGRIAFTHLSPPEAMVATMNPDGSDLRYLRAGGDPAWSGNGRRIVFRRPLGGGSDVYTMRADGSRVHRLTSTSGTNELSPAFSPSGKRIVFWTAEYPQPAKHFRVVSIRSDGTHRRVLAWRGVQPEWAPNGKHIVYQGAGIEIMRPDGTHKQVLYSPSAFATGLPHYTSDGRSIVFGRCRIDPQSHGGCGSSEWMQMGAFGGNLHRLPALSQFIDVQPSPAGGCFVGFAWRTYPDGSGARNVRTSGLGCPIAGWLRAYRQPKEAIDPSWQPLPQPEPSG